MDGLLVIDKPSGPTSHDVVARMRRALRERRIGHTGTLDPMASGVLPLVVGRATRLARFMSAGEKSYDAVVTLGVSTDTYDAQGEPVGPSYQGPLPVRETVDAALDAFRGSFLQRPPAFSAKKIAGRRAYAIARAARKSNSDSVSDTGVGVGCQTPDPREVPEPVRVTTTAVELRGIDGASVTLRVDCSAGFYVRSLAHDLGERLGTGAHLSALRRTRSGEFTLADAVPLDIAEADPAAAARQVRPLAALLVGMPATVLTAEGVQHATHGRELGPGDFIAPSPQSPGPQSPRPLCVSPEPFVRLVTAAGDLVGIAVPARTPGLLHPSVILM